MSQKIIFVGYIIYSNSLKDLNSFAGYLCVEDGVITKMGIKEDFEASEKKGQFNGFRIKHLGGNQFLMPGFIDCHTHAPQFPNLGLGLDRPLLEWLDKYTFPLESKYKDVDFAARVYDNVVQRLLINGTTTACYFGSLHKEGSLELVKSAIKHKQRALVGKVSMNIQNDAGYYNDTATELKQTEEFIKKVLDYKTDLVQPIVTPRFAVSCDDKLMHSLTDIALKYDLRIQSHVSENTKEIEYVLSQFPGCANYSDIYDKCGILTNKCIMAHAVFLSQEEQRLFAKKGVSVAHCPASNTRLRSGLCPVRQLLNNNVNVGLGTDVSGGDSSNILDAIRRAVDVSTHLDLQGNGGNALDWKEGFFLATLGGAIALNLDDKIGNFAIGKEFDALVIDVFQGQVDDYGYPVATNEEHIMHLLQRFLYIGDDRNIVQVYVKGNIVKDIQ
ncbi:guanine deaminase [Zerene cesonia]|uniref:guanine deaminase n=1 Tax=Zerene cesonia TaxID=33412 RepID=UPI0018E4F2AE|nr:guanine deaminase [Zerene cesonia]